MERREEGMGGEERGGHGWRGERRGGRYPPGMRRMERRVLIAFDIDFSVADWDATQRRVSAQWAANKHRKRAKEREKKARKAKKKSGKA